MKRLFLLSTMLFALLTGLTMAIPPRAQANNAPPNLAALPLMFIEQQPHQYTLRLANRNVWFTNEAIWLKDSDQATPRP